MCKRLLNKGKLKQILINNLNENNETNYNQTVVIMTSHKV